MELKVEIDCKTTLAFVDIILMWNSYLKFRYISKAKKNKYQLKKYLLHFQYTFLEKTKSTEKKYII